ncbi:hypothetical protein FC696_13130 [Bacillus wiedmannii]|uniref:hypothetical protein n=1 Tax=Bacillus wiedmannii TaxID=1890302 RepID=UPI0010BE7C64|nr:hypothetical protein [Bacillus wiedmannii]TKI12363.1 hypothetical protein FC696_13130 [Bacillus wiedmannii]
MNINTVEDAIKFHGRKFAKFGKGEAYIHSCVNKILPIYEEHFTEKELSKIVSTAIVNSVGWLYFPNNLVDILEKEKEQKIEDELLRQQIEKRKLKEQALKFAQDFREGKRRI